MKKICLLGLLVCMVALMGCETFKGMAKDIENTGQNIGEALRRD